MLRGEEGEHTLTTISVCRRENLECFNNVRREYKDVEREPRHIHVKKRGGRLHQEKETKLMNKQCMNDIRPNVYILLKIRMTVIKTIRYVHGEVTLRKIGETNNVLMACEHV
jgi:hypothetical protein